MRQYFYVICHCCVGDDFNVDKVFLQEYEAIKWGRRLATKMPEYSVYLYKQEITRTATLKFSKHLQPYSKEQCESPHSSRDRAIAF